MLALLAILLAAVLIAWAFVAPDHRIEPEARVILVVLGVGLVLAALTAWLYTRQRHAADRRSSHSDAKLDEIHGEAKALHTRHDNIDQRDEDSRSKIGKLRRGFSLLFHGETEEKHKSFGQWWRSWHSEDDEP